MYVWYLPTILVHNVPKTLHAHLHKILPKFLGVQNPMEQNLKTTRVNSKQEKEELQSFPHTSQFIIVPLLIRVFYFQSFTLTQ